MERVRSKVWWRRGALCAHLATGLFTLVLGVAHTVDVILVDRGEGLRVDGPGLKGNLVIGAALVGAGLVGTLTAWPLARRPAFKTPWTGLVLLAGTTALLWLVYGRGLAHWILIAAATNAAILTLARWKTAR